MSRKNAPQRSAVTRPEMNHSTAPKPQIGGSAIEASKAKGESPAKGKQMRHTAGTEDGAITPATGKATRGSKGLMPDPERVTGLALHVENWVNQKAKDSDTDPCIIVNQILNKERVKEKERCKHPFVRKNCYQVARWKYYDGRWEQLLYENDSMKFFLEWSWADPVEVKTSEALHWYGQKRAMDSDYGSLEWPNLATLITQAASELREWERVQERGFDAVQADRQKAYAEFKQLDGKEV